MGFTLKPSSWTKGSMRLEKVNLSEKRMSGSGLQYSQSASCDLECNQDKRGRRPTCSFIRAQEVVSSRSATSGTSTPVYTEGDMGAANYAPMGTWVSAGVRKGSAGPQVRHALRVRCLLLCADLTCIVGAPLALTAAHRNDTVE